ncbi:MAG: hypothetical protein ABSC95_23170 [Acetobacteraceae bacterium]|jgi:hypothetical protein
MFARFCALVVCLSITACAAVQRTDTAQLPPAFYGTLMDNDIGAINEASWALGSPDHTRGDPVEALRAAVAVEYLAGELNTNPRWEAMSPIAKMEMLQARGEFRRLLGIKPDVPAQVVVNAEIRAVWDLERGDAPAAQQVLSGPIFTLPPQQTMQVLNNLPTLPAARAATAAAELEEFRNG